MSALISILIPAYNEAGNLERLLAEVSAVPLNKEILVIDDGSTDATAAIAERTPKVRTLRHESNRGRGAAILTGIRAARGDIICVQDADGEQDPASLPRLVEPIAAGTARVVYGSRFLKEGQMAQATALRQMGNRLFAWLARVFFKQQLTDVYTGAKCFERSVFDEVHLQSTGFEQEVELLAKLSQLDIRIHEVPVTYRVREADVSKMKLKDGFIGLYTLLQYAIRPCKNLSSRVPTKSSTIRKRSAS